jgi:hypothetical protein
MKYLVFFVSFISGIASANNNHLSAIERIDDIRARLLAHSPDSSVEVGEAKQQFAQWFNFPNWPNWGNWNNWNNWGNWGNWLNG